MPVEMVEQETYDDAADVAVTAVSCPESEPLSLSHNCKVRLAIIIIIYIKLKEAFSRWEDVATHRYTRGNI